MAGLGRSHGKGPSEIRFSFEKSIIYQNRFEGNILGSVNQHFLTKICLVRKCLTSCNYVKG